MNNRSHLESILRLVDTVEVDGVENRRTIMSRTFSTTVDDLWDAISNPERIPRWFLPVTGDFRVGGRFQFEGNAGGAILRCDEPTLVEVTWEMGQGMTSSLALHVEPDGRNARLRLEHVGVVPEELWTQFGPAATGMGWDGGFFGLYNHLETGGAVTPEIAEAWAASPDGIEFMTISSELWTLAAIDAGMDPNAAAAASAMTLAMYTGQTG